MKKALCCPLPTTTFFLLFWLTAVAQAQITCPDPPNRVTVTVNAAVTFDTATNLYTYAYEVFSDPTSVQDVDAFSLDAGGPLSAITSLIEGSSRWLVEPTKQDRTPPCPARSISNFPARAIT